MSAHLRGHLAMLAFSALVAGSFSLGSIIMSANSITPVAFTAVRFAIAAIVIGAVAGVSGGIRREALKASWRYLVLGGLFAFYFVLMFEGLKTATPISTAAVFTLTPVLSAGFGWLILRQVTTLRMATALTIGAIGACWVIFRADWNLFTAFQIGRGEVIYFWGCIAHAVFTPMVRRLNRGEHPMMFSFCVMVAGCIVLLIYGWGELQATNWNALSGIVWMTILYVSVFASALTFVLLQFATLRLPSAKVMAYTYLTPSWVILWEISLGHGAPGALVLVGIVLTVVALMTLLRDEGTG